MSKINHEPSELVMYKYRSNVALRWNRLLSKITNPNQITEKKKSYGFYETNTK